MSNLQRKKIVKLNAFLPTLSPTILALVTHYYNRQPFWHLSRITTKSLRVVSATSVCHSIV